MEATDASLRVLIILDITGSMSNEIEAVKQAVAEMVCALRSWKLQQGHWHLPSSPSLRVTTVAVTYVVCFVC
jgi:hypothetical protein